MGRSGALRLRDAADDDAYVCADADDDVDVDVCLACAGLNGRPGKQMIARLQCMLQKVCGDCYAHTTHDAPCHGTTSLDATRHTSAVHL